MLSVPRQGRHHHICWQGEEPEEPRLILFPQERELQKDKGARVENRGYKICGGG